MLNCWGKPRTFSRSGINVVRHVFPILTACFSGAGGENPLKDEQTDPKEDIYLHYSVSNIASTTSPRLWLNCQNLRQTHVRTTKLTIDE
jgi:hypothetical protein